MKEFAASLLVGIVITFACNMLPAASEAHPRPASQTQTAPTSAEPPAAPVIEASPAGSGY